MTRPRRAPPKPIAPPPATGAGPQLRTVELIISWLLRVGVWSSIALIVAGLALLVVKDHAALVPERPGGLEGLLHQGPPGEPQPRTLYPDVLASVRRGEPYGVITLGLLVLLLTPVLRVAVTIVAFLLERDWLYTAITAAVLCLLLAGIALGKAGG